MKKMLSLFFMVVLLVPVSFGQFSLPALPYAYDALEPYIDSETMNIHYNNHHATYVKNLNAALKDYPELQKKDINFLLTNLETLPVAIRTSVRNNGGGHYNHSLFWQMMAPAGTSTMSAKVKKALEDNFGSIEAFKSAFESAASGRFGSGWVWLIKDEDGKLKVISTPNQDNPLMSVSDVKGAPVLALDVWEHAYYLKYQSKRADYVKSFWEVVNWKEVEKRL